MYGLNVTGLEVGSPHFFCSWISVLNWFPKQLLTELVKLSPQSLATPTYSANGTLRSPAPSFILSVHPPNCVGKVGHTASLYTLHGRYHYFWERENEWILLASTLAVTSDSLRFLLLLSWFVIFVVVEGLVISVVVVMLQHDGGVCV